SVLRLVGGGLPRRRRGLVRVCRDEQPCGDPQGACSANGDVDSMTRRIHVLELRSVRGTGGGPEKTILLGAERADHERVAVTVCYIRDAGDAHFGISARARQARVDYVELVEHGSFDRRIWPQLLNVVRDR